MKNPTLEKYQNSNKLPIPIKDRIKDVLNEDEAYAADELVTLSEEILLQLASIGMSAYLSQPKQKQVYNDFILQLFTSNSDTYNAGPLYRWVANMIQGLDDSVSKKLQPFFWQKEVLNEDINKLSLLRNAVMHGFFILPAERNHEEANHIAKILTKIIDIDLFTLLKESSYHFLSKEEDLVFFNDDWSIEQDQWQYFDKAHDFGELTKDIQYELSERFDEDQLKLIKDNGNSDNVLDSLNDFLSSNNKGAMSVWARPNQDLKKDYSNLVNKVNDQDKYLSVFYNLDSHGVNFTSDFLLNRIVKKLSKHKQTENFSKSPRKALVQLRKECDEQVIVILNNIHIGLFNTDHILHLSDLFYENNIIFIVFGSHHPWMDQFFNQSFAITSEPYLPSKKDWEYYFKNYLRFKGPNEEVNQERDAYLELNSITSKLLTDLKKEKTVVARRFADKHQFSMEYVHEAFAILHPFLNAEIMSFELDELDPLYNFPKETTESSRILFSIGRRDTKLEYQHKTLQL